MSSSFAIYIHWPFCLSKCPYCDFNSHVRENVDYAQWEQTLIQDLASLWEITSDRKVTSIFFGGGTPSLMPPQMVENILQYIQEKWTLDPQIEITLEANPTSVEQQNFQSLALAGVNRISLGIQALDDKSLGFLGRPHSAKDAQGAMETAAACFNNYSFDLIYTRPDQTLREWEQELKKALSFNPHHLSLYQLTIEEGTPFYLAWHRGDFKMPPEEESALLFEFTNTFMIQQGMPPYEVSNYGKPGQECRHNLTYWRYHDYGGVGPGAHSRLTLQGQKYAIRRHRSPEKWIQDVQSKGTGVHTMDTLSPPIQHQEYLMMSLRLTEGLDLHAYETQMNAPLLSKINSQKLQALSQEGFLTLTHDRLILTAAGRQRLNSVLNFLKEDC